MATDVAFGHYHAIVVIAVEVSTVAGSTLSRQRGPMSDWNLGGRRPMMETMPDWDLSAWRAMMECTTGNSISHMTNISDRHIDTGRDGGLGMRIAR